MTSSASGPVLGIDLGTTNSVIAITDGQSSRVIADPEGNRLIPSCVSFPPDGSVLVGHQARERRLVDASNTVYSIKRLIGRPFTSPEVQRARELFPFLIEPSRTGGVQVNVRKGTYALPEISAMVLRHLRKVAEHALGVECKRAVITVPANFNELQRSATQAAGKVAGLDVLRILHEPTAATLAYGYGKERPETTAVYDFGGGTFDITVLDLDRDVFEVVSTAGDTFLGGDDIDLSIAHAMADACVREHRFDARSEPQAFERMRAAAEWAKCQLSEVPEAELTLEELFVGDRGETVDFRFQMTREELDVRMRPLIARTFDVVGDALREAGRRPREIDNVVLVGGSTRIPLVRQMVEEFFGKPARADVDPDLVVSQGAAIHAWTLAGRPQAVPRPGASAGGRVGFRKITVAEVAQPPAPITESDERIPKQPAFAPDTRRAAPPPVDRSAIAAALAASGPKPRGAVAVPPPVRLADELARSSLAPDPVAELAPPIDVGRGLLELDVPHASSPASPLGAFDDPFAAPVTTKKKPRRDVTVPFETSSPPIDAPFDVEVGPPPTSDALARDIAALEEPLPLPEPRRPLEPSQVARDSMMSGLFEVELDSMPPAPPEARAPEAAPQRPPPPPRRPPPPPPVPRAPIAPVFQEVPVFEEVPELDPFASIPPPARPALAPSIPDLPLASSAPAPLLMDVTPLSLGLETAGGYCADVVPRNAPVPAEKSRIFSTGRDDQDAVELRICQGESSRFAENQPLGTLVLDGIRKARRGEVRIDVTFLLDANGILDVRATDVDTGRVQQTRIHLQGGLDHDEIEAMRQRQDRELA